jgi:hypothetical protein
MKRDPILFGLWSSDRDKCSAGPLEEELLKDE